ncbi:Tetraspanin-8 [Liparis tanakae]|uniref:Tetraspanin n=1 Tax=Liparis tanakae TaxID=230148 RepID=A0A4Z2EXP5_9TELE|nr:Tetraspanin-8 [Liparis tanakae]
MVQVNACLKLIFTIFNIFFAIVGGVIIALALLSQVITNVQGGNGLEGRTVGLIVLYTVGAITMVIAILGAYGAHRENRACLIVFLVCMVIGSLMTLRAGIPALSTRPELEDVLEAKFRELLPLDKASSDTKNMADSLQSQLHCCGLFSYMDWEDDIPDTCLCDQEEEMEGRCQSVSYQAILMPRKSVYIKTCFPIILHYVLLLSNVMIGVTFTLAALALLGLALSSAIIHQMRSHNRATILMTVPAIFTTPPPKYQELHNPPGY